MRIPLTNPARKVLVLVIPALFASVYFWWISVSFLAAYFSTKPDLRNLERAVRLQPGNADYRYRLGRYAFLVQQSPEVAIDSYQTAIALNPHQARYWFDLAAADQLVGKSEQQVRALEHALHADPTTPELAWEAANLFLVQGDTSRALQEFRVVLQNDPYLPPAALKLCWRIKPDVDALLNDVIPANSGVYTAFLDFLVSQKETSAAAKVWAHIVRIHQPIETSHLYDYVRYLISQREVDQARLVWQQAAGLCGLSSYQPSPENLVVNGDFSLNVLNGGFDWLYERSPDVALALDPTQSHSAHRSLRIIFDSRALDEAGIRQLVPVQPSTTYDFSAFFKAEDIQGAGGPRFAIEDSYTGTSYFLSDELKNADFWKEANGSFTTGPDTKLLVLRIQRVPAGSPIRGKLWIDGVRLTQREVSSQ